MNDVFDPTGVLIEAKSLLRGHDRFAVLTESPESRETEAIWHQYALYYLYPAEATDKPDEADVLIVIGNRPVGLRSRYNWLWSRQNSWIGRSITTDG